jgi:hypothetical protein
MLADRVSDIVRREMRAMLFRYASVRMAATRRSAPDLVGREFQAKDLSHFIPNDDFRVRDARVLV